MMENKMAWQEGYEAGYAAAQEEIDKLIDKETKGWTTERMSKVDLTIIRLGVYELLYDDTIPEGVAINEAVELAKLQCLAVLFVKCNLLLDFLELCIVQELELKLIAEVAEGGNIEAG